MKDNDKDRRRFTKVSRFMEKLWLAVAIISLLVVIYFFLAEGVNRRTLSYLIFPALAGTMYGFRYAFRKRFESRDD
jgi:hypothetical protein